jgi:hypothetical protein
MGLAPAFYYHSIGADRGAGLCSANGPITFVAGTAGTKGGRSVVTEQAHSKQIYQRIGSLNVKTVRYSLASTLRVICVTIRLSYNRGCTIA